VRVQLSSPGSQLLGKADKGQHLLLQGVFQNPAHRPSPISLIFPGPQALVTLFRVAIEPL